MAQNEAPDHSGLAPAEQLFAAIGLFRRHTRRRVGRPWPETPLTGSQVELVRLLRRRPGTSVAEAAAALGLAANTVSTLVRQLTDAGLIERVRDESDRRVARLALTGAARSQVERWRDRRNLEVAAAFDGLSAEDRAAIESAIPALIRLAGALHPDRAEDSDQEVAR
ncbi:MarR family winged helix-turn-helix transcriptional regulator [Rhodococcus koreensis]|uniref:MarR family winged helix-turn-helix transcriptional regulator n=1 Tax=Rhodococcus koreensis TaxID=99653 RepID=UPI0019815C7F|nr:MarR family transcriptional regulator [Rhodococcus koreensis]QSE82448.1 MarR family transcriptional regulator [Rhodococcus koreensis]